MKPIALLAAVAILFAILAYEVREGHTMHADLAIRNNVHALATPALTAVLTAATFIGRGFIVLALTFIVFGLFWRARHKREAGVFLLIMAGEPPLEFGLKWAFHRPRPAAFFGFALPSSFSFPSGHALAAALFYGGLAVLLTPLLPAASHRIFTWTAAFIMIVMIGLSRVYLGVHYPTDVLAGYLLGAAWICCVASTGLTKRPEWRQA